MIANAQCGSGPLELESDAVHVWCAGLNVGPETSARLYASLSVAERSRCSRFRFARDRRQFVVAHGALRDLLGRYLRVEPARVAFVYNSLGKPELDPGLGSRLQFNLSHSAGLALIAVAADSRVGVDHEYVRARPDYADIARRFFSTAENYRLSAAPEHLYAEAFLRCWTRKEAYVKARGGGLSIPLDGFSVPMTIGPAPSLVEDWSIHTLNPAPRYVGAVAVEGTEWRMSQLQWKIR